MLKIEAVIQPFKLDEVKAALDNLGIEEVMISAVLDHGGRMAQDLYYRGASYRADVTRIKLEMLVSSDGADDVIEALSRAARTREPGEDGTILVYEVADAIRIRSGERIQFAIR